MATDPKTDRRKSSDHDHRDGTLPSKSVLFTHHPITHKKMLKFAAAHGLPPKGATTAKYIISKVMKIDQMQEVQKTLDIEGGTTVDFIEKCVHEALHRRGYFREKRGR